MPGRPGGGEQIAGGISRQGAKVTLTRDCGSYDGAQPYFTIARQMPGRRDRLERFTPHRSRADAFYEAFLGDVTDPADLHARVNRVT